MAKPKIIVRPKRIVTRKQRKAIVDTSYLLDENKKIHKTTDSQLVIASNVLPTTPKKKKTKKEYVGRKKDRKKSREKKKAKRIQEQQDYSRKSKKKKRKSPKPVPTGFEAKPVPTSIESKPTPTVDIFDQIEDYIMDIPDNVTTWRKGQKGWEWVDLEGFKMACVSIVREYSMSENPEIKQYFMHNEYAIKESIDGFHEASTENDINDKKQRLLNLLAMGRALTSEQLNILSLFEN
nr:MAG TPA_asm: hypothetical protein [Caudoviricetes sp.]